MSKSSVAAAWLTREDALVPKSVLALRSYSLQKFGSDLVAGLTVGLVAFPLAMAFAISSGVQPQAGLYCAIVAGFIISALGGSMTQIGGPTGAFVVVVSGIVGKHGLDGLFMCTLMAGVLLMLLGISRLGTAVKYIPRPVVIGFTNGIAVLIASTQVKDFFGLQIDKVPGEFVPRIQSLAQGWHTLSIQTTAVSLSMLLVIMLMAKFVRRVPGAIVVLVLGTALVWGLGLPLETVGNRFGDLPSSLPVLQIPQFRPELILPLLSPALTVTMLGAIESLLSAVVADRMTGDRHNPNIELVAQGVANVVSPMVGGLPATGAIARTATNIRSGARSPVAGMVHAVTLLAIVVFAAPLAGHIPLAILASILLFVAYNMGEWSEVGEILKLSRADIAVWLITFVLTVFADLTVAVEAGMILAALLYIQKVTSTTTVSRVTQEYIEQGIPHSLQANELPEGVAVYRIHGPFLFGSSDKLSLIEQEFDSLPKIVMLRLRNMNAIDATGLHALESLADRLHASGRHLIVCGMQQQPARLMERAEFHRHLGDENICPTLAEAIARARVLLLST
ncbi:MAG: C4-dicarboxylic acid transporter DauA [Fimbriimonadaceae bacterium]|nr:C4-dicarboxylic acid transporter DauA [Fimbriimonadaceae bacterium]